MGLKGFDIEELRRRGATVGEPVSSSRPADRGAEKKWSNAQPTAIGAIRFPSKTQAATYERLVELFGAENIRLDVRMPLLAGVKANGRVLYQTIDFCIVENGKVKLWIDAKTKRKSREWTRGLSMFRVSWGDVHEWDGKGDPPWPSS